MIVFMLGASLATTPVADTSNNGAYTAHMRTQWGQATITQSGPVNKKPIVRRKFDAGSSILEQDSGGNYAIIIQQRGD